MLFPVNTTLTIPQGGFQHRVAMLFVERDRLVLPFLTNGYVLYKLLVLCACNYHDSIVHQVGNWSEIRRFFTGVPQAMLVALSVAEINGYILRVVVYSLQCSGQVQSWVPNPTEAPGFSVEGWYTLTD